MYEPLGYWKRHNPSCKLFFFIVTWKRNERKRNCGGLKRQGAFIIAMTVTHRRRHSTSQHRNRVELPFNPTAQFHPQGPHDHGFFKPSNDLAISMVSPHPQGLMEVAAEKINPSKSGVTHTPITGTGMSRDQKSRNISNL